MNYVVKEQLESVSDALFRSLGPGGVYARTARFEQVVEGLAVLISRYREEIERGLSPATEGRWIPSQV